jgi:ubiquinone/menaquinone biosynthesis C-methylase UbiE
MKIEENTMSNKQYFDQVAPQWDKMRETFFSKAVRKKVFAVAGIEQNKLAADIGAGTGFVTEGLIEKGLSVIAVDQSETMLAEMKSKFANFEGIEYRVGEAESLPIVDETVDYVFANMYLHHVESPLQAIKEAVRILKPRGKLIITDLDEHEFEFLRSEHHDRWMGFRREDIKQWFTETWLKNVTVDCVGENCCAQSSQEDEYASISIFVASGEK